jgi:hypothetical protein
MQNRNMFLYRRQGPKKRSKPNPSRKNRSAQKGLPNSARDLLPLIQPTTKALAQMLAGRVAASGQLGHARAVLAQTERLMADRAHNRLNPQEREEFFEQVARLRLTISDAESEAEVQAAEHEAVKPAPVPVNRERLKELALALTTPAEVASPPAQPDDASSTLDDGPDESGLPTNPPVAADKASTTGAPHEANGASVKKPDDPNQLRLPRAAAERVAIEPDLIKAETSGRRRKTKSGDGTLGRSVLKSVAAATRKDSEDEAAAGSTPVKRRPTDRQKLPKGWIIDDDGFVVPGTG